MLDAQSQPVLIALMIALAAAGVIFAVIYPYLTGERRKDKRVQGIADSKARRAALTNSSQEQSQSRKKNVADTLKEMETRQKAKEKVTLRLKLERAGLDVTPRDYYIASAISAVLCGALIHFGTSAPFMGTMVGVFVGAFGLPRWVLSRMIKKRQYKFTSEMANAIDVVVRGVKSGLPLNECLQVIARESPEPLAGEFRDVVEQQRMGVPLGEALERLCQRMPLAEVRFLTIVISIQQQAGGNLSEALGNLSGVLRDRFQPADEGEGALRRSQGLGHGSCFPASGRHVDGLYDLARIHHAAVHDAAWQVHARSRRLLDDDGRAHHAQDDQLQVLEGFALLRSASFLKR